MRLRQNKKISLNDMKALLIILIALFSLTLNGQKNKFYQRDASNLYKINYSTIKITFEQFKEVIKIVEYYVKESEQETDSIGKITIKCEFTQGNETEIATSFEEIHNLSLEKDYYTEVRFQYYTEGYSEPISGVGIYFSKFVNGINISGSDHRKINALCRALDEHLGTHETVFSRISIPATLKLLVYGICAGLIIYLGYNQQKIQRAISKKGFYVLLISLGAVLLVFGYIISNHSEGWFPKLTFTAENASWYRRNESEINLISFILGVLGWIPILVGWIKNRINRQIKKELQK